MSRLCTLCDTEVTFRPTDIEEDRLVTMFLDGGCGCSKWKGRNCVQQFSASVVQEFRHSMSAAELYMLLMGQLVAFGDISDNTSTEWRHAPTQRTKIHYSYHHKGKTTCLKTFLFLHGIGIKRFKNITKSFHENGIFLESMEIPSDCLTTVCLFLLLSTLLPFWSTTQRKMAFFFQDDFQGTKAVI